MTCLLPLFGFLTAVPIAYQRMDLLSSVEMLASLLKCVVQCLILVCSNNYYLFLISMPIIP